MDERGWRLQEGSSFLIHMDSCREGLRLRGSGMGSGQQLSGAIS